ncbi:histidine phosphatase family protein, partial [Corynebacterium dentalis]|uniref:histidine phosphatase family protein n=1 Tax=Corynebacterium dentalis TaxID=2014528 RepID=UPI00289E1A54
LTECDYGQWQGQTLADLAKEDLWKVVQTQPSAVVFPGGESLAAMQARAVAAIRRHDAAFEAGPVPAHQCGPGLRVDRAVWPGTPHRPREQHRRRGPVLAGGRRCNGRCCVQRCAGRRWRRPYGPTGPRSLK